MKLYIGTLALVLFLASCGNKTKSDNVRLFEAGKAIQLNENEVFNPFIIIEGNDIIFNYSFTHPQDDRISDDELTEVFVFSIPGNWSSFDIAYEETSLNNLTSMAYARLCYCGFSEPFKIFEITASGKKISDSKWEVKFNFIAKSGEFSYPLSDEGIYYQAELD